MAWNTLPVDVMEVHKLKCPSCGGVAWAERKNSLIACRGPDHDDPVQMVDMNRKRVIDDDTGEFVDGLPNMEDEE